MTELYLVPVSDDWMEQFQQTVETPVETGDAPDELRGSSKVRVWGTTAGKDSKKRTQFEAMAPGDLVLFYNGGTFFAGGHVDQTFENPELGAWLWDNPESRFIFTLADYEHVTITQQELWDLLDYSPGYSLQGFSRVSDTALNSLEQSFNSVEEAFQDLKDGGENELDDPDEPDDEGEDVREHTEIQWHLIQLGLKHGYDVYVATNDQNLSYEGTRLGEDCVNKLSLTGFSDAAMRIIEYVDVIWLNGGYIEKMFEVESTTSIFSGILRMTDFVVKVPNLSVDMYIVAGSEDEEQVRKQMSRPTFQHVMGRAEHCSLQYVSFEEVREKQELVERAGALQSVF
jgi:hypothetical protein